jgi:ABC-type amino acid transport substrate-binding protein/ABC-type amino acid transport system permease subunit
MSEPQATPGWVGVASRALVRSVRGLRRRAGELLQAAVLIGLTAGGLGPALAQAPQTSGTAASAAGERCARDVSDEAVDDAWHRIVCRGLIRIGLRTQYPPFSDRVDGLFQGFEVDLAQAIANRLGVRMEPVVVTPANRIAALGEGRVDLVIATMGHTVQRDAEARFVRPHYYQSRTAVVGRRGLEVPGLEALWGRSVCVTVGNNSNADLSAAGARLMLFDRAPQMIDHLLQGSCSLAAQDDTFFAPWLRQRAFAERFDVKFGFAELPWGIAVAQADGARLQEWLGRLMRELHAQGRLQALAQPHGVDTAFLVSETRRWSMPPCAEQSSPEALREAGCLYEPRDNQLRATAFAGTVTALEQDVQQATGVKLTLAMLKTRVAFELFLQGLLLTTLLMVGAVVGTVSFGALFAKGLGLRWRPLAWLFRGVVAVIQSTPLILLMFLAGILTSASAAPSVPLCMAAAILMLGIFNGANAGQAVAEARARLLARAGSAGRVPLATAFRHARSQVIAFAINAVRGSPAASLIGVPEVLSALTDIASFSSERVTTYLVLLLLYMTMTALVFRVAAWLQRWMDRRPQAEAA